VSGLPGTVVHVSTPRSWRGGEQQVVYLAERLRAAGVAQLVVCPPGSAMERACGERGLPHAALRRRASVDPLFARALARTAGAAGAALVHAHDPHGHAAAVLSASLFGLRAPLVVHRRVAFPIGRGPVTRWKYDHPAVRRIVCVSRAIADGLRAAVRDPSRLRVVHSATDAARFAGVRPDGRLRREHGLPAGVPLVGYVAALTREKGHEAFVEAAARVLAAGIDARFVAVGDGPLRGEIAALVRARGLEGRVVLTGFRGDIPAILPELDLVLFTSRQEGLGSSLLDAFACRVPVVATAVGGIPEVVVDGETGLLAPVDDAAGLAEGVRRVLGDPALRARLVEGGVRRLAEFGVERMAERTLEVYREVVAEAAGRGDARG
jgi:glycosyltransferase involved in cell wall biosynthesis